MKYLRYLLDFFSTIAGFFKGKSLEKKQEQRVEQVEKVESFKKETVRDVERGKIDAINEKLKF